MKLQGLSGGGAMSPSSRPATVRIGDRSSPRGSSPAYPSYVARAPEGIVDVINIALQLAFILIFVIVLARYLRDPREVHRDLVLVFASVVALFAIAIARTVWPDMPRPISQLSTVVLLLQPFLTLRLASHFVAVPRSVLIASLVWFAGAVVGRWARDAWQPAADGVRGRLLRGRRDGRRGLPPARRRAPGGLRANAAADRRPGDHRVRRRHLRRRRRLPLRRARPRRPIRPSPSLPGCSPWGPAWAISPRSCRRWPCAASSNGRSRSTWARRCSRRRATTTSMRSGPGWPGPPG